MTGRNITHRRTNKAVDAMHDAAVSHGAYERAVCVKAAVNVIRTDKTDEALEEAHAFAGRVWDERFEHWGPC